MATHAIYKRKKLNPGVELIKLVDYLKENIKELKVDRLMQEELNFSKELINSGKILNYVSNKIN